NTKIINSTITENRARTTGAGIMSAFSSNILTTMTNTLVVDNTVAVGGFAEDVALYLTTNDTFVSGGNNMIGALGANVNAFSSMTDLVNVSVEQLGPLQDNGGATLTHALLADSLAINAANSSACPALDQRGVLRPQGSGCDIGAFELDQFLLNLTIDGGGDGAVVSSPAGINCTEDCMGTFAAGSTVSLTATASSDATFMGWSGACSGTAVCQLTLDESKEVTATFVTNEKRIYLPLIMRP
ncbi:MAG: choice-of-anchor Q domain-containing protein, partial [Chloroflexota bacterium]